MWLYRHDIDHDKIVFLAQRLRYHFGLLTYHGITIIPSYRPALPLRDLLAGHKILPDLQDD